MRPHLLMIDESETDVKHIHALLKAVDLKFTMSNVNTLEEGLAEIFQNPPGLILLNLNLPDSAGLQTFKAVHKFFRVSPFIILTESDQSESAKEALELGAQDYLVKSELTPHLLAKSIHFAIERNRIQQELNRKTNDLEHSENRLKLLSEENRDAILVVDKVGIIIHANPAAQAMLKHANLAGREFGYAISPKKRTEIKIPQEIGPVKFAEMDSAPIEWEKRKAYLVSLRDITERKLMEREITEANKKYQEVNRTLERKVRERTKKLEDEKMEAERNLKIRELFLDNLAHEVEQPLETITNAVQSLHQHAIPHNLLNTVERMEFASYRLLSFFDQVLDIALIKTK